MKNEEKEHKPRYGTVNFDRRRYPRFNVDLPIEYYEIDSSINHTGRAFNASDGGCLLYLTEQVEIGQMSDDGSDLFLREQWIKANSFHMLCPVRKTHPLG